MNPLTAFLISAGTVVAAVAALFGWDVSAIVQKVTSMGDKFWIAATLVVAFVRALPTSIDGIKAALLNQPTPDAQAEPKQ